MDEPEVDDFLAHYGVKGMKWGVRRSQAQLDRAANRTTSSSSGGGGGSSSSGSGSERPKRKINKKKVATAAGVVGLAAAVTVGAVMLNQKQRAAGQAFATSQMKKMGGDSTWDVLKNISTEPKKPPISTPAQIEARKAVLKKNAGEAAVRSQIQNYAKQSKWDIMTSSPTPAKSSSSPPASAQKSSSSSIFRSPATRRREGEEAAKKQIKEFASRSVWDLASDTSLKPKTNTSTYSNRARKIDSQLYGTKNAEAIARKVDKGIPLSEARKGAAFKTHRTTAAKVAVNIGTATAQEKLRRRLG